MSVKESVLRISLPAGPEQDLCWDTAKELAEQTIKEGREILWELELGIEQAFFCLEDEMRFQELALSLHHFSQEIWPSFQSHTQGVVLYRGSLDFLQSFHWTSLQLDNWECWKLRRKNSVGQLQDKRIFCTESFVSYFQLLAHELPDDLNLILSFDPSGIDSPCHLIQIVSRERFDHFQLEWIQSSYLDQSIQSARLGVCFPEDAFCSSSVFERFEEMLEILQKKGTAFRIVYDAFLTEQWEDLDVILVIPEGMSPRTERRLKGFEAAGGEIVLFEGTV